MLPIEVRAGPTWALFRGQFTSASRLSGPRERSIPVNRKSLPYKRQRQTHYACRSTAEALCSVLSCLGTSHHILFLFLSSCHVLIYYSLSFTSSCSSLPFLVLFLLPIVSSMSDYLEEETFSRRHRAWVSYISMPVLVSYISDPLF